MAYDVQVIAVDADLRITLHIAACIASGGKPYGHDAQTVRWFYNGFTMALRWLTFGSNPPY